jgi:hypothetical protein
MELFDIVKNIFSQKDEVWKNVSRNEKTRNFFMINRIMAIQFPLQAQQFNKLKVSPSYVVDWWRNTLNVRFSKVPNWIYTKTNKKEKSKKAFSEVNQETEDFVRLKFQLSKRDLLYLKSFYPDRYVKWTEDLSEQLGFQK